MSIRKKLVLLILSLILVKQAQAWQEPIWEEHSINIPDPVANSTIFFALAYVVWTAGDHLTPTAARWAQVSAMLLASAGIIVLVRWLALPCIRHFEGYESV